MAEPTAGERTATLASLRAAAGERVARLEADFQGLIDAAADTATDDEHDPEGATLAFERQQAAALLAAARERVRDLDTAVGRAEAGDYGRCERCGNPIGAARLAARPQARRCVACAPLR